MYLIWSGYLLKKYTRSYFFFDSINIEWNQNRDASHRPGPEAPGGQAGGGTGDRAGKRKAGGVLDGRAGERAYKLKNTMTLEIYKYIGNMYLHILRFFFVS